MNKLTPVVEKLLWLNVGLFMLQHFGGVPLIDIMGLRYIGADSFSIYQFLTHLFVHGSIAHLFSNMFSLYTFGPVLERTLSSRRFLAFYLLTGLGAAVLYSGIHYLEISRIRVEYEAYLNHPSPESFQLFLHHFSHDTFSSLYPFSRQFFDYASDPAYIAKSKALAKELYTLKAEIPTVGASGAIFGLLTAFAMLFPNVALFIFFIPIPIKAKYLVALYTIYELYAGVQDNPADNVAHFAHLGGVLLGYLYIRQWQRQEQS